MAKINVTLPSGLRGTVRGLKGKEINMFANMTNARSNKTIHQVLGSVWVATEDVGSAYDFVDDKVDWSKVLLCDRFTALLYARVATWGAEYEFKLQCGACRKRFEWALDLTDLPIKELSPESIEAFRAGNRFTTTVLDEDGESRKVTYQLVTPAIETKIERANNMSSSDRATLSLAQRIVSVEGLDPGKGAIKAWLNELEATSLFDLIDVLDENDGGIDTEIEIECPHCGAGDDVELPLDRREFWNPKRSKKN